MKPSPHADLWGSPPPQIVDSVPAAFASTSPSSDVTDPHLQGHAKPGATLQYHLHLNSPGAPTCT
jgi:hypothetical protein